MGLTLKTKKRLTIFTQSVFFLLGGIEYVVILPTLNEYLGQLNGNAMFFGFTMAAFSITGVLGSPIFGLVHDRYHNTKLLILFANLWEIGGNFMYFYGGSKYILLISRLIAGVGGGVNAAIFADISLTSTESERSSALVVATASRQIGLMLGPAFNLPFSYFDFYVGPFPVNSFTAPGIVMCIMFIILEIITIFCYFEIPPVALQTTTTPKDNEQTTAETVKDTSCSNNAPEPLQKDAVCEQNSEVVPNQVEDGNCSEDVKEEFNVCEPQSDSQGHSSEPNEMEKSTVETTPKKVSRLDALLRDEVVVLLWAQFVFLFGASFLETSLPLMTKRLLDFGGVANSILFAIGAIEVIIGYVIVTFLSRVVPDRIIYIVSLTVTVIPFTCFFIVYANATPGRDNLWWFVSLYAIEMAGAPFLYLSIVTLFTKVTPIYMQGFAHGMRRVLDGIGSILGPIWAGNILQWPYETLGATVGIFLILWFMSVFSIHHLRPLSDMKPAVSETSEDINEEAERLVEDTDV